MIRQLCTLLAITFLAASAAAQAPAAPTATFPSGNPTTTNNDDSCDIAAMPAATLLLPWFEVDLTPVTFKREAVWTVFTLTNVSPLPQIVRVTLWTDRAYPVVTFNIFLTGYDAQRIDLYDLLVNGTIPSTSSGSATGSRSAANSANPNFAAGAATACASLGGTIEASLLANVRSAFTTGSYAGASGIGNAHTNAAGYVTADVVATCSAANPLDSAYFTSELLFDNVLIGDYVHFNGVYSTGNYALATTMVHLRAIPEGGPAGAAAVATNLPFTFYDRYTPAASRAFDRRQPLPTRFATRWIQGGTSALDTDLLIWREGTTGSTAAPGDYAANAAMPVSAITRFDEHENATTFASGIPGIPAASRLTTSSSAFPPYVTVTGDVSGWFRLDLQNGGSAAYSSSRAVSQNWIMLRQVSMGLFGSDMNAAMLSNGCTFR